ncbi:MAG: FAD-binding oxidoreductase [Gemmatimonadaceae bacterium]|nr:FAD-binding oxidoreductase [Gemmatimonadaceae bacterium]
MFRDDPDARGVYAEAAGIARVQPRGVAVPVDADDVVALVQWAHATGTPLVPRGAGSSMAGGAIGDGVVVDLTRLDQVGPVDAATRRIRVGAGATRDAVNAAAAAHGLWFPVDPSSGAWATVGGMVATNAAGPHALGHGAMRAWVAALDCVFEDGTRALVARGAELPVQSRGVPALRRFGTQAQAMVLTTAMAAPVARLTHDGVRKEASGYGLAEFARTGDIVDLLVGSEGTLALVVGAELRLTPAPQGRVALSASFATLEEAVDAAGRAAGLGAATCELLDRTFLDIVRERDPALPVAPDAEALLLADAEGASQGDAESIAAMVAQGFRDAGAITVASAATHDGIEALWAVRHAASPLLAALAPDVVSMQFIEDGAVPPIALPEYVRSIRRILEHHGMRGAIFGHAGDANVHVNPLVDLTRPDWRAHVEAMLQEVVALTSALGGTLTGEHGDGRLRTPLLERVWSSEAVVLFDVVKRAFDPRGLLNPGVKVPLPGQRALGDIKYDPALPPLPEAARQALAHVAAERAYATPRLALLERAVSPA